MNVTRKKHQARKVAADKMEKLIVLVGLIVHIFFKKNRHHVLVAFSVGCQFYRFLQSEMGHSLFCYFFEPLEMISCVFLFFWTCHSNV